MRYVEAGGAVRADPRSARGGSGVDVLVNAFDVLDWRRRVADLYRAVRQVDDPPLGHELWRRGREQLLREHPASPLPEADRRRPIPVAPYDAAYRFVAPVQPAPPAVRSVDLADDGVTVLERAGVVDLAGLGTLAVWWLAGYGGGLFLPVADASADTYGGGRYVLDTAKGADLGGDRRGLVVDLNFAFQPSCAYDPRWVCPLPEADNRLDAELPVGERHLPE